MKRTVIVAAVVLVAGIGACDKYNAPGSNTGTGTSSPSMSAASERKSDMDVQSDVERALNADSALSREAKNVSVSVGNDKIVLNGALNSSDERERVEYLARQNSHGYRVDNNIEIVKP